jgi:tetratricopeptide (TPR) repeat protein
VGHPCVARQALGAAERELLAGIDSMQTGSSGAAPKFPGVGLEWLLGLIALARGDAAEALARFARELAQESRRHLYTRECSAHAWYAIGAVHLRQSRRDEAAAAFREAITRVAAHPARVVLAQLSSAATRPGASREALLNPSSVDAALGAAIALALQGDHASAASAVGAALAAAEPGSQAWLVPVEPLLGVSLAHGAWAPVLGLLSQRAA